MNLRALTFDIIGTLFDVHRGLAKGVGPLNTKYSINVSGQAFSHGSIAGCAGGVVAVNGGGAWTPPDLILRAATRDNLPIQQLGTAPRPDVAAGMHALHRQHKLAVLSNMSVATQTALRAHAGLPVDRLLSAATVKAYKPRPAVYQMAVSLGFSPGEILRWRPSTSTLLRRRGRASGQRL